MCVNTPVEHGASKFRLGISKFTAATSKIEFWWTMKSRFGRSTGFDSQLPRLIPREDTVSFLSLSLISRKDRSLVFRVAWCRDFFLNWHRTTNNREDGIFSLDKRKIQRDRRLRWNRNDENEKLQLRCFPIEQWRSTVVVRKTRTCPPMSLFPSPLSFPLPESTPL